MNWQLPVAALLVAACSSYALWNLMPRAWRSRLALWCGRPALAASLGGGAGGGGSGCGGCDGCGGRPAAAASQNAPRNTPNNAPKNAPNNAGVSVVKVVRFNRSRG